MVFDQELSQIRINSGDHQRECLAGAVRGNDLYECITGEDYRRISNAFVPALLEWRSGVQRFIEGSQSVLRFHAQRCTRDHSQYPTAVASINARHVLRG